MNRHHPPFLRKYLSSSLPLTRFRAYLNSRMPTQSQEVGNLVSLVRHAIAALQDPDGSIQWRDGERFFAYFATLARATQNKLTRAWRFFEDFRQQSGITPEYDLDGEITSSLFPPRTEHMPTFYLPPLVVEALRRIQWEQWITWNDLSTARWVTAPELITGWKFSVTDNIDKPRNQKERYPLIPPCLFGPFEVLRGWGWPAGNCAGRFVVPAVPESDTSMDAKRMARTLTRHKPGWNVKAEREIGRIIQHWQDRFNEVQERVSVPPEPECAQPKKQPEVSEPEATTDPVEIDPPPPTNFD